MLSNEVKTAIAIIGALSILIANVSSLVHNCTELKRASKQLGSEKAFQEAINSAKS